MGRKKIAIKKIMDNRQRTVTFTRRRNGIIKKAHELSILCDCKVALLIFDANDRCHTYCSTNLEKTLLKYAEKSMSNPESGETVHHLAHLLNENDEEDHLSESTSSEENECMNAENEEELQGSRLNGPNFPQRLMKRRATDSFIGNQTRYCHPWELSNLPSNLPKRNLVSEIAQPTITHANWRENPSLQQQTVIFPEISSVTNQNHNFEEMHKHPMKQSSFQKEEIYHMTQPLPPLSSVADSTMQWTSFQDELATDTMLLPLLDSNWNYQSSLTNETMAENSHLPSSVDATVLDWTTDNPRRTLSFDRLSPLLCVSSVSPLTMQ